MVRTRNYRTLAVVLVWVLVALNNTSVALAEMTEEKEYHRDVARWISTTSKPALVYVRVSERRWSLHAGSSWVWFPGTDLGTGQGLILGASWRFARKTRLHASCMKFWGETEEISRVRYEGFPKPWPVYWSDEDIWQLEILTAGVKFMLVDTRRASLSIGPNVGCIVGMGGVGDRGSRWLAGVGAELDLKLTSRLGATFGIESNFCDLRFRIDDAYPDKEMNVDNLNTFWISVQWKF